jgi:hypothetical protein
MLRSSLSFLQAENTIFEVKLSSLMWSRGIITLLSEILFDPTNVVLNSLPTLIEFDAMLAGDCVGDGRYTIVPADTLGLIWFMDRRRFGVFPDFRSCKKWRS